MKKDTSLEIPPEMREPKNISKFLTQYANLQSLPTPKDVAKIVVLPIDLNASLITNYIINEAHNIDVPSYAQVIQPDGGSFYNTNLVLTVDSTKEILVEGTDYILVGMNYGKTKLTKSVYGVYDFIFVTASIVGQVNVTYRAFGGQVTRLNISDIKDLLIEILTNITSGNFLRCDTISMCPAIITMQAEIDAFAKSLTNIMNIVKNTTLVESQLSGSVWITNKGAIGAVDVVLPVCKAGTDCNFVVEELQYLRVTAPTGQVFSFEGVSSNDGGYIRTNNLGTSWAILYTGTSWLIHSINGPLLCDE